MKRKLRRVLRGAAFTALLLCVLAGVTRLVERKASRTRMTPFLRDAAQFDVLFIGDSHVVNDVLPMELWRDYGIASYNIASYGNTMAVSYWAMMNALDYATPKLMVIGTMDVEQNYKLSGSSSDVHTALDAFPLTLTKARAIEDLMNGYAVDDDGRYYADMKGEYYFTLGKYHSRWSELTPNDFHPAFTSAKGGELAVGVATPRDYELIDEGLLMGEDTVGFDYLRRMIEECQRRGIDVLLTNLPYPATETQQMASNAVYYVAQDYGVDYLDFVYLDQVVDYRCDMYDSYSHLNASGAQKVTDYLGRYLRDHYDLPDRHEDAAYLEQWNADYAEYLQMKHDVLLRAWRNLNSTLMLLHDADYSACVVLAGDSPLYADERAMRLLQNIGRSHIFEEDGASAWSDALEPLGALFDAAADGLPYIALIDRGGERMRIADRAGAGEASIEASFGRLAFTAQGGALRIAVDGEEMLTEMQLGDQRALVLALDSATGEVVEALGF